MIHDIVKVILNDTKEKLGFPLKLVEGESDLIYGLSQDYGDARLRAMWAYYISDEREIAFGVSATAFSDQRRLARLAARVTKVKAATGYVPQLTGYICERDVSINYIAPWCMGDGALEVDDDMPACHPDPCQLCNGRMWWVGSSKVAELKEAVSEHFKTVGAEGDEVPRLRGSDGGERELAGGEMRPLQEVADKIIQPRVDAPVEDVGDLADVDTADWF